MERTDLSDLPEYKIATHVKKPVGMDAVSAVVKGDLSAVKLRRLLIHMHESVCHSKTPIIIFLYTDSERLEDGWGHWIARLVADSGEQPKLDVREDLIARIQEPPHDRFGLTEPQRKQVFREYVWIEEYHNRQSKPGTKPQAIDAMKDGAKNGLAVKCRISRDQLEQISLEGMHVAWPMGELPPDWKPPNPRSASDALASKFLLPAEKQDQRERDARGKLELAKFLLQDGFNQEVRKRLEELIQKFPGTTAAEEAARLLKERG